MTDQHLLVGIDLGGTKIEGVVVDAIDPTRVRMRIRRPTQSDRGYPHVLEQICALVDEMRGNFGADFPCCVGIGTPGTLDPVDQTLRGSNTACLNGKGLVVDLEQRLGAHVVASNDANCFGFAEATLGAGRNYQTVFAVIMGTGCGGAFVVDERVLSGRHGITGEWGQIVVEPGGDLSPHGTRGTVEAYISGPAVESYYFGRSGIRRSLAEIAALAPLDSDANATIERLCEYFARSLAAIVNTFDPHAIVIGGGVGHLEILYSTATRDLIAKHVFARTFATPLLKPALGASAGVFGAALLTRQSCVIRDHS